MKFNRGEEEDFNLNVTSLVDIVLMLLIFFMVSSAFFDFTKRMDVQLPSAEGTAALSAGRPFSLEINGEGRIFIDGAPVKIEEIKAALEKDRSRHGVVIRADRKLYYGLTVQVMGICKEAGIKEIGLAVL